MSRPNIESRFYGSYAELFDSSFDSLLILFADGANPNLRYYCNPPVTSALWRKISYGPVYIQRIDVEKDYRSAGHASRFLKTLCRLADFFRCELTLEVEYDPDDGGLLHEQLCEWYWRHEFWGEPDGLFSRDPEYQENDHGRCWRLIDEP